MNASLEFTTVTEMHFVLTMMEVMNVLAKETTSGMEYHVSICIIKPIKQPISAKSVTHMRLS